MEHMTLLERLLVGFLAIWTFIGYAFCMAYLISCLQYFKWHD